MIISVVIQKRQPDGSKFIISFKGQAQSIGHTTKSIKEEIAEMLLEAEMKGNSGNVRVHITAMQ